jgi:hypothetical protein
MQRWAAVGRAERRQGAPLDRPQSKSGAAVPRQQMLRSHLSARDRLRGLAAQLLRLY